MSPPGSAAISVYEPEQLSREDREQQLHLGPSPAVFEGRCTSPGKDCEHGTG